MAIAPIFVGNCVRCHNEKAMAKNGKLNLTSFESLRTRLVGRGSDPPEVIEDRLEVAREELAAKDEFTHVLVNDRLEDAVQGLSDLVATIL